MDENLRTSPYGSARDLPSYRDLAEQVRGFKLLTLVVGRKHRPEIVEIERQLNEMVDTVDRFYELLGDRNWIFHDDLNLECIKTALKTEPTPEVLEQTLIDQYQEPNTLDFMTRRLTALPDLRVRDHLIQRALDDYRAERYYAATLVLLTVMDGFVNDVETKRTGLHARSPEDLIAWDSVVGHHKGLSHAHRSFIKSTGKTTDEETFELRRHGILHGTILYYDNVIVATKAWNRLFAVADWARSMQRQAEPTKPKPSLKEVAGQLIAVARDKKALADWKPHSLVPADEAFTKASIYVSAHQFLEAWRRRDYGALSRFLPDRFWTTNPRAKPARVREAFEGSGLNGYQIKLLDFVAAAVCEVTVQLDVDDQSYPARLRWIREKPGTNNPAIRDEEGEWRLYTLNPQLMISRAN